MKTLRTPPRLRCVSFNLLHGGMSSGRRGTAQELHHRLALAVTELQRFNADIIALQEASTSKGRGNIAAQLAARLGLYVAYAPASCRIFPSPRLHKLVARAMNFTEGPALLSRFPLARWEVHELPRGGRITEPRVLLIAVLRTPWGLLRVASTHTSGVAVQHRTIAAHLHSQPRALPLLLMGDFNAVEDSEAMTTLTREGGFADAFRVVHPTAAGYTSDQALTTPIATVTQRIDYVFIASGTERPGRILSSQVILDTPHDLPDGRTLWPSDHYGVLADIALDSLVPAEPSAPVVVAGR